MSIFNNHKYNVLILGSNGMLGSQLYSFMKQQASMKCSIFNVVDGVDYPEIDVTNLDSLVNFLRSRIKYDYVVNCSAITDTRGIQTNDEINRRSYEVNALACKFLAETCRNLGIKLVHVSTDYVFSEYSTAGADVDSDGAVFNTFSTEHPVNDYGMHKLMGEMFIKNVMDKKQYAIIRVSWLYGKNGRKSFVHKFLKNVYSKSNDLLKGQPLDITMPQDEISGPTSVGNLCMKISNVVRYNLSGVMHGNDDSASGKSEPISRFRFAQEILENFKDEFPNVNLVPVDMNEPENGQMRYPKRSYMVPTKGSFAKLTLPWQPALKFFCEQNKKDIMNWLENG